MPSVERGPSVVAPRQVHVADVLRIPTTTSGAIGELIAAADLMRHGYHVFRALSPSCPADLVAYRGASIFRIQVRSAKVHDPVTNVLTFNLKDSDRDTFDVLALVIEDREVIYLPRLHDRLPSTTYRIQREQLNRLRAWGVFRGVNRRANELPGGSVPAFD